MGCGGSTQRPKRGESKKGLKGRKASRESVRKEGESAPAPLSESAKAYREVEFAASNPSSNDLHHDNDGDGGGGLRVNSGGTQGTTGAVSRQVTSERVDQGSIYTPRRSLGSRPSINIVSQGSGEDCMPTSGFMAPPLASPPVRSRSPSHTSGGGMFSPGSGRNWRGIGASAHSMGEMSDRRSNTSPTDKTSPAQSDSNPSRSGSKSSLRTPSIRSVRRNESGRDWDTPGPAPVGVQYTPFSGGSFRSATNPQRGLKAGRSVTYLDDPGLLAPATQSFRMRSPRSSLCSETNMLPSPFSTTLERRPSMGLERKASKGSIGGSIGGGTLAMERKSSVTLTSAVVKGEDEEGNKTINEYAVISELGRGSYGKVKLALHTESDVLFAIKIMNKSVLSRVKTRDAHGEKTAFDDVLREIAIMKRLDHPNIVTLHEVIDDPDSNKLYLILDYLERGPVFDIGKTETPLPICDVRKHLWSICQGLDYLHQLGIIHKDVKPDNILVDKEGVCRLTDFGVSQVHELILEDVDDDDDEEEHEALVNDTQGTP
eukprot:Hpha_TRINITY_DN16758_c2_g1::TRINITY_DN16758_c2_g1_i1::g.79101::m.79101/K07359/CAMKK2; calcium/calmodulin-dependent protein kinase kinase 2